MEIKVSRERLKSRVYKFDKQETNHGCAVIISISEFTTTDPKFCDRKGSVKDKQCILNILKTLKITSEFLETKEECERDKILNKLKDKAKAINKTPYNYNSFYCFILSYGGHGFFYDSKAVKVSLNEIMEIFDPRYCPGLVLKPKLFFLHLCDLSDKIPVPGQIDIQRPPLEDQQTIPTQADFITYYSLFSTLLYRYMQENEVGKQEEGIVGSAFITCLHSAIVEIEEPGKLGLNSIVYKVNREMDTIASNFINRYCSAWQDNQKQSFRDRRMPYFSSTATKTLLFDYI